MEQKHKTLGEFTGDIILKRIDNVPHININQEIIRHSPTGMEWGYAGSGPSDLALNILAKYTTAEKALRHYQRFKSEFICNMPDEGGIITASQVKAFLVDAEKSLSINNQMNLF